MRSGCWMSRLGSLSQRDRASGSSRTADSAISTATSHGIQGLGQTQNTGSTLREEEFKPSNTEEPLVTTDLMMSCLWFLENFFVCNFVAILSLRGWGGMVKKHLTAPFIFWFSSGLKCTRPHLLPATLWLLSWNAQDRGQVRTIYFVSQVCRSAGMSKIFVCCE